MTREKDHPPRRSGGRAVPVAAGVLGTLTLTAALAYPAMAQRQDPPVPAPVPTRDARPLAPATPDRPITPATLDRPTTLPPTTTATTPSPSSTGTPAPRPTPTSPAPNPPAPRPSDGIYVGRSDDIAAGINAARTRAGAPAARVSTAGYANVERCVRANLAIAPGLNHSLSGCGYENLAWFPPSRVPTRDEAVNLWLGSPAHRRVMLDPRVRSVMVVYAWAPGRGCTLAAHFGF